WHVAGAPDLLLRPFYALGLGQPYFVYLDPALQHRVGPDAVRFRGAWRDAGRFRYSDEKGASAELAVEGAGIRWLGSRFDDAGLAEVTIDDKAVARVDQYGPGGDLPFEWKQESLEPGRHVLRIVLSGERTSASKGTFVNVAGFEVLPGPVSAR